MASKAFEQICKFLDEKEFRYGTDLDRPDREVIYFGARGLVEQSFIFIIETEANVVQFRSSQILDEDDLKNYHSKPENRAKLFEYLLKKNYELKLGKFALDPEDPEVDLYFVLSDYVDAKNGIEVELLDRMHRMLFGPSFAPSTTEKAIKDIKSILATGEKSSDDDKDGQGGVSGALGSIAEMIKSSPEMAKSIIDDPDIPDELKKLIADEIGSGIDTPETLAKKAQELLAQGKTADAMAIISKLSGSQDDTNGI